MDCCLFSAKTLSEPVMTYRQLYPKERISIQKFSFKKMHLNISSAKWQPFCFGPNVLKN